MLGKHLLQLGNLRIPQFLGMVRFLLPPGSRMKLSNAFWQHIAVATSTVQTFPVLPSFLKDKMIWVQAGVPMAEVTDFFTSRPTVFVGAFLIRLKILVKKIKGGFVAFNSCRAFITFLRIVGVRQNAAILVNKHSLLNN